MPKSTAFQLGRLPDLLRAVRPDVSGEMVDLGDPAFEQHFVVRAADPAEARSILSPRLRGEIISHVEQTGNAPSISWVGSCMYIAFAHKKNWFEPRLVGTIVDRQVVEGFLAELGLAIRMAEALKVR